MISFYFFFVTNSEFFCVFLQKTVNPNIDLTIEISHNPWFYLWLLWSCSKCHSKGTKVHRGIMHQTQQQWFNFNNQQRQMTKHEATWCKSQATVMLVRLYKNKLRGAMWPKLYGNLSIKWPLFVWPFFTPGKHTALFKGLALTGGPWPCEVSWNFLAKLATAPPQEQSWVCLAWVLSSVALSCTAKNSIQCACEIWPW